MFSVTCLGKNGLYPTKNEPTSGYLIKCGDTRVLVDIGSGVFAALLAIMRPEDLDAVIVSHFHGDHSSDLTVFNYYLTHTGKKLRLYAPETGENVVKEHNNFIYNKVVDGETIALKGVIIKFFKTNHPVHCLGVKMVYDDKTFVYSADTNVCENLDHALEGADLAVLDCAFSSATYKPNGPHLSSVLCAEYAKKYNVKTLLSHLPPEGDVGTIISEANKITDLCRLIEKKEYFI